MKKIIIPTDFSENARSAIKYVIELMQDYRVHFILINTYDPPSSGGMLISIDDIIKKEAEELLEEELKWFQSVNKYDDAIEAHLHFGTIGFMINDLVEKYNADFVAMGTKGASGLKEIIFGSNTATVIEKASCPVLAIPDCFEMRPYQHILFPVDFKQLDSIKSITNAKKMLEVLNCEIDIIYVNIEAEENQDFIIPFKEKINIALNTIPHRVTVINNDDVLDTIQSYINAKRPDLVITIPQEYGFFENLFHDSVTEALALESQVPLLAIK